MVGLIDGEALTTSGVTSTFNDQNVAIADSVTVTAATLGDGTDGLASNYSLATGDITSDTSAGAVAITAKILTAVFKAADKVYDGMKTANATLFSISGMVGAETLTVSNVGSTFSDKNVDDNKTVTINSYTLVNGSYGGLAINYSLASDPTTQANISTKTLTVSGLKATDKVYDGNNVAALTGNAAVTILGGDSVTLGGTTKAVFNNESIGTDKTVTVLGNALSGTDAANYTLVQQAGLTADISALNDETINATISLPKGCTLMTSQGLLPESGVKQKSKRGGTGSVLINLNDLNMSGLKTLKCG